MVKDRLSIWCFAGCLAVALGAAAWHQWKLNSVQHRNELPGIALARSVDDPASNDADLIDWEGARDFLFKLGDGSAIQGYNLLVVEADGQCSYTFSEPAGKTTLVNSVTSVRGKRATFQLDAETRARFRKLLKDVDFFRLKKEYHADVSDGTPRWARAEVSGHRKAVHCNNFFPKEFLRISRFVNDRIIAPNSSAIDEAKAVAIEPKELDLEDNK